jgi:hypothetical protein
VDRFIDALVQLKIKTGTTVSGSMVVNVFAYAGIEPDELGYSGEPSGADEAYGGSLDNCHSLGVIGCPTAATTFVSKVFSIASLFGGRMPDKWGIIIENKTGAGLNAVGTAHACGYVGLWEELS